MIEFLEKLETVLVWCVALPVLTAIILGMVLIIVLTVQAINGLL